MTPTSKFIAVKYHWFREHVGKAFDIVKISENEQIADMFTKGLQGERLLHIRKLMCGWWALPWLKGSVTGQVLCMRKMQ